MPGSRCGKSNLGQWETSTPFLFSTFTFYTYTQNAAFSVKRSPVSLPSVYQILFRTPFHLPASHSREFHVSVTW